MKEKLLSIVIPTYNMEKYLDKCLTSLIISDKELMKLVEVLIINDGSKDNSSAIGHRYQEQYPETYRVVDKENGNYGSCINRGLKEATGRYIKILDADDWFDTPTFEAYLHFLSTTKADLVLSDFEMVKPSGENRCTFRYPLQPDQHVMRNNKAVYDVWMHAVTYRRAIFEGLNYHQTEGISHTDIEWIFLPMVHVKSVDHFPHVVYKYLIGREGQTMNPEALMRESSHEIQGWKANWSAWESTAVTGRGDAEEYLWYRLLLRATIVYDRSILGCRQGYRNQELIDFDNYVKDHSEKLYEELDSFTFRNSKFRYIHYWRKWFHCRILVLLVIKIENKLACLKKQKNDSEE